SEPGEGCELQAPGSATPHPRPSPPSGEGRKAWWASKTRPTLHERSVMPLPIVAIVGRPNVGKSPLFNWLANRRISIVDPTAGVTRDRIGTVIPLGDRYCELVDTGGMGIQDVDNLTADVEKQIQHAIDAAAVVLFVV